MPYIGKSPGKLGVRQRYHYTATGSETSKSGPDDNGLALKFDDGEYVDVYLNGSLLVAGSDYNTATTNTISGLAALTANDILEVVVYDIFSLAKVNTEAQRTKYYKTASGSETSISGTDDNGATITFTAGAQIDVRLNGVSLKQGDDYNTTVANTVGGLTALTAGQLVEIVVYEKFVLADMVKKSGDTMTGGLNAPSITSTGDLTVDTNTLHVDSTNNSVGVGTSSPTKTLDVNGQLRIRNSGVTGYGLLEYGASSTATNNWHVGSEGDGSFRFYNGNFGAGTERMKIDSSGRVTMPYQPGFLARRSIAGDGRSAGSITEWSVTGTGSYNTGNHFSTSTGRFTAPVAGTYAFSANPGYLQTNVTFNWYWQVNGSNIAEGVRFIGGLSSHSTATSTIFPKLAANDYVSIYINTTHHVNVSFNTFSGILIG